MSNLFVAEMTDPLIRENMQRINAFMKGLPLEGTTTLSTTTTSPVPTGCIVMYAGKTIPVGYLKCDGSMVSKETYSSLYALIKGIYGAETAKDFKLPNLTSSEFSSNSFKIAFIIKY